MVYLVCAVQVGVCGLIGGDGGCGGLVECMFECFIFDCFFVCYVKIVDDVVVFVSEYMICVFGQCGFFLEKSCWEGADSGFCFLFFGECF